MAWKPPSSDQYSGFCASIILPSAWEESPSDSPPFNISACQRVFLGVETDISHYLPPGRIRAAVLARRVVGRQQAYGQDRELTSSHVAPTMSATAP